MVKKVVPLSKKKGKVIKKPNKPTRKETDKYRHGNEKLLTSLLKEYKKLNLIPTMAGARIHAGITRDRLSLGKDERPELYAIGHTEIIEAIEDHIERQILIGKANIPLIYYTKAVLKGKEEPVDNQTILINTNLSQGDTNKIVDIDEQQKETNTNKEGGT